jgi:hypothetical protein
MKKYNVGIREVWVHSFFVEAEDEKDAIIKAEEKEGEDGEWEYSHELESSKWTVHERK